MTLTLESSWDEHYEFYNKIVELFGTYDTEKRLRLGLEWGSAGPQLVIEQMMRDTFDRRYLWRFFVALRPGMVRQRWDWTDEYETFVLRAVDGELDGELFRLLPDQKQHRGWFIGATGRRV